MGLVKKLFPFISWFPIPLKDLGYDVVAGATVALVLIPQSMAYAQLAGLPAYYGLYAAFLPGIIGALWGSSRHLASGPTAVTSLITATVLSFLAVPGSPYYISLAILMALMIGIMRLFVGILRLTSFTNYISLPVIRGFTNAAAFIIAFSQLYKIFGTTVERSDFFLLDVWHLFEGIGNIHPPTLIIGIGSIVVIFLFRTFAPWIPFALLTSAAATLAVYFLGWNVEVIGAIPAGLPAFQVPHIDPFAVFKLLPGSLLVLFISFMEVCSVTRTISAISRQKVDMNQEMIGQGLAAITGSFFQAYPGGGSFSRSALTWSVGGRTSFAAIVSGGIVLCTLLFFTRYLYFLPQATLAAIIIISVIGLVDFKSVKEAWQVNVFDGITSIITFVVTLLFAPQMVYGILVGVGFSFVFHLFRLKSISKKHKESPEQGVLVREKGSGIVVQDLLFPVVSFSGRLYFAKAPLLEEQILSMDSEFPDSQCIIFSGENMSDMDATGEIMLRNLVVHLREGGVDLVFAGLTPFIRMLMKRTGLDEIVGTGRFYPTLEKALEGERARREGS